MCSTCNPYTERFLAAFEAALRETAVPEFPSPGSSVAATLGAVPASSSITTLPGDNSWVELTASLPFDTNWVQFRFGAFKYAGSATNGPAVFAVDIGIGGSGSEIVVVQSLQVVGRQHISSHGAYLFPIRIPAGTRVVARSQPESFDPNYTIGCQMLAHGGGFASAPPAGRVVALGGGVINPGSGGTHTDSGWIEITASTPQHVNWLSIHIDSGDSNVAALTESLIDIGVGSSGNEVEILSDIHINRDLWRDQFGEILNLPVSIPAGSRLAIRGRSSVADFGDSRIVASLFGC